MLIITLKIIGNKHNLRSAYTSLRHLTALDTAAYSKPPKLWPPNPSSAQ